MHGAPDRRYQRECKDVWPAHDRPLIVQLAGDDEESLCAAAVAFARLGCDGVDLNLGCPQGIARKGHYGAFLLPETALIARLVGALARALAPLGVVATAKVRLLESRERTLATARALEAAGAALLTVHGRTKEENKERVMACGVGGMADLDAAMALVKAEGTGGDGSGERGGST